jgi:AraC-like DNA-binding protein
MTDTSILRPLRRLGYGYSSALLHSPVPLEAGIAYGGFETQTSPRYDWHGLKHGGGNFALFQYTIAGRGQLRFEERYFELQAGDAMLVCMPHDHRYWLEPGDRWEFFWVQLHGSAIIRLWKEAIAHSGPRVRFAEQSAFIAEAILVCEKVLRGGISSALDGSRQAYSLTMALLEETYAVPNPKKLPSFVEAVRSFCRANLSKPVGVDQLADIANMSRSHFSREFRRAAGVSPARFLAELRLERSIDLMQQPSLSIKEVSAQCGFSDSNYFCKTFRKRYGVSPGAMQSTLKRHSRL